MKIYLLFLMICLHFNSHGKCAMIYKVAKNTGHVNCIETSGGGRGGKFCLPFANYRKDTSKSTKVFKSTLYASKTLAVKLELKNDFKFTYTVSYEFIYHQIKGNWKIVNDTLKLIDDDTSKIISVKESINQLVPKGVKRFEITDINKGYIGFQLSIKLANGKNVEVTGSSSNFNLKIGAMSYFEISSIIPFSKFFPQKSSNLFEILINADKASLTDKWLIKNKRLHPLIHDKPTEYYLEETP